MLIRHLPGLPGLDGLRLVAGGAGVDREARGVSLATGPADIQSLAPGIVAVTALRSHEAFHLDSMLRVARNRRAAGVVHVGPLHVMSTTARMADRLALPLLVLDDGDPIRVAADLTVHLHAPQRRAAELLMAVSEALPPAPRSPDHVVDVLSRVLRRPVSLLGPDGTLVAGSPEIGGAVPGHAPYRAVLDTDGGHLVLVPVVVDEPARTELWLAAAVPPSSRDWLDAVARALAVASYAVASSTARERLDAARLARDRSGLLSELLDGTQVLDRRAVHQAVRLGWRLDGWHTGVYVRMLDETAPQSIATAVTRALATAGLTGAVAERTDGLAFWSTSDREPASTTFPRARQLVARALAEIARDVPLAAGMGRPYEGASGVGRTLAEAREASLVADMAGGRGRVEHIDGLGARRFLARWHQSAAFSSYARSALAPLLTDEHADLLDTLHVYLDRESSATGTATHLGVHRNTVMQRIERAQRLLSVDLSRPDERLVVHLACQVLRGGDRGRRG
jgi:sugar diacid utilization regulator